VVGDHEAKNRINKTGVDNLKREVMAGNEDPRANYRRQNND